MDILAVAHKISNYKRVSLESIYKEIMNNCPDQLKQKVGDFIGAGWYGEVYELAIDSEKVIKFSVSKDETQALREIDDIKYLESMDSPAVPKVYDYGILCDVDYHPKPSGVKQENIKHGVAYYYVMERLYTMDRGEVGIVKQILEDLFQIWDRKDTRESEIKQRQYIFRNLQELRREAKKRNQEEESDEYDEWNVDGGLFKKILELFEYLKSKKIFHHDAHEDNIMQNADGDIKLIDLESIEVLEGTV